MSGGMEDSWGISGGLLGVLFAVFLKPQATLMAVAATFQ